MHSIHSGRLERWLGVETVEALSQQMRGWYGPPIHLLDVPGSVRVGGDGDFVGQFDRGFFASARDAVQELVRRAARATRFHPAVLPAGFASISDALAELSGGKRQYAGGSIMKIGVSGTIAATNSLWQSGPAPPAGAVAGNDPGGTVYTSASTGALGFTNPAGGDTTHLIGADLTANVINHSLLVYDRLFGVNKSNMNTTGEIVCTGLPTRYQNTTANQPDSIGGNFAFVECTTVLPSTAHNWAGCTYKNQADAGATFPTLAGIGSCSAQRLDMPLSSWFFPLATGDTGVKAITGMTSSAAQASGAVSFVIGHPIGVMAFPIANQLFPFDWLTNRDLAPRILDNACLALLELCKPAATATTYSGFIYLGQG